MDVDVIASGITKPLEVIAMRFETVLLSYIDFKCIVMTHCNII